VQFKNSRPYHPQTCGKVERLDQTLKRYLAKQAPARTLQELQQQLNAFAHYYNDIRLHTALQGRTPLGVLGPGEGSARRRTRGDALPRAPGQRRRDWHRDLALPKPPAPHRSGQSAQGPRREAPRRRLERLHDHANGELIRELTLDPSRDYQPLARA
jgi:hypothetical protein